MLGMGRHNIFNKIKLVSTVEEVKSFSQGEVREGSMNDFWGSLSFS
jgi:hypothetical protein